MIKRDKTKILILTLFLVTLQLSLAHADLGNHPEIYIKINKEGKELQDQVIICTDAFMAGRQRLFQEKETKDYKYIRKLRNRHEKEIYDSCFYAETPHFSSWTYSPAERIAIIHPVYGDASKKYFHYPEKTSQKEYIEPEIYESKRINPTSTELLGSNYFYKANINTETGSLDLKTVRTGRTTSLLVKFILLLITTILIELAIAWAYLKRKEISIKALYSVAGANVISFPIVFIIAPMFIIGNLPAGLILGEILIIPLEAFLIHKFSKGRINYKKSVILSLIINIFSFLIGELFFIFLMA